MFVAVDFKNGEIGVLDKDDNSIEYYAPSTLKHILKTTNIEIWGITLDEKCNPMFTIEGLTVNLLYLNSNRVGKYRVVLLREGEYWGRTFSSKINKPTVAFFDTSVNLSPVKYPSGQYIASYYAETLLEHIGGLMLDTSVPSWVVEPQEMEDIKEWLQWKLRGNS